MPGRGGEDDENCVVVGQNGSDVQVSEQMGTLKSSMHKRTTGPLVYNPCRTLQSDGSVLERLKPDDTVDALHGPTGNKEPIIGGVRRLTPTECLRLMGLPDDWLDLEPPLSDSAKYRLIGNSVGVPVVEWIGRRIVEIDSRGDGPELASPKGLSW